MNTPAHSNTPAYFEKPGFMTQLAHLVKENREITTSEQRQAARLYLRALRLDFKLTVSMACVMFIAFVIPGGMIEMFPNALPYGKLIGWDASIAIFLLTILLTTTVLLYRWRINPLSAEMKRIADVYNSLADLCGVSISMLLQYPRRHAEQQIVMELQKLTQEAANVIGENIPLYQTIEETPEFSLLKSYMGMLRDTDLEIKDMKLYLVGQRAT